MSAAHALGYKVAGRLGRLRRYGYNNDQVMWTARDLAGLPDRASLAEAMITDYLALPADERDFADDWHFAAALAYVVGADQALRSVDRLAERLGAADPADFIKLRLALGEADPAPPSAARHQTLVASARRLAEVFDKPFGSAIALPVLAAMPPAPAEVVAEALLAAVSPREGLTLALDGVLAPLERSVREIFGRYLDEEAGADGHAVLAAVEPYFEADGSVGSVSRGSTMGPSLPSVAAEVLAEAAFNWPIVRAAASSPDGFGCQVLYVIRRRGDGSQVIVGGLVSPGRGLLSWLYVPDATDEHEQALQADYEESPFWPVDAGYVGAGLRQAVASCRLQRLPLPLNYLGHGGMLAGVPTTVHPDAAATARDLRSPALLELTGLLIRHWAFVGRTYMEHASPHVDAFLDATAAAVEGMDDSSEVPLEGIGPELASELEDLRAWPLAASDLAIVDGIGRAYMTELLPDAERLRWRELLYQDAYLFAQGGQELLAKLAGTAAGAIDPDGGLPLEEQPFVRDLLRMSALRVYMD
jgi:hypothetical protein